MQTFWHPYTDDSPEAMIDVSTLEPLFFLQGRGLNPNCREVAEFRDARNHQRPYNHPRFGCLVHKPK